MFENYADVVGVKNMMSMLGIGRNTAYDLLKGNIIPSIRIGRIYKIPKVNIIEYLQSKR